MECRGGEGGIQTERMRVATERQLGRHQTERQINTERGESINIGNSPWVSVWMMMSVLVWGRFILQHVLHAAQSR